MGAKGILFAAVVAAGAQAQQDPMRQLMEIRHKVADRLSHIPRYLCTETVDRATLRPDAFYSDGKVESCAARTAAPRKHKMKMQLMTTDRLRLDVAIIDNNETYSWVGEGRFEDKSLSEMVRVGATSTGSFGSFLQAIFLSDSASFAYKGETEWKGRRGLEYTFAVPLWRSSYTVATATLRRRTAFVGAFTADAQTLDLLRLEIHADSLPPELQMCELNTTLDYTQVQKNKLDFLLPAETDTQLINMDGLESRNRIVFSGCHQFLGESKLIFDDPAATALPVASSRPQSLEIPAGLTLSIALEQIIDPAKDAAGDVVKGVLKKPVELPAGATIPKGTPLNGRICELLVMYGEETSVQLGIQWDGVELNGANWPLALSVQSAVPRTAKTDSVQVSASSRVRSSQPGENHIGYFSFTGVRKNYRIPAGFESLWMTLPAALPAK
jgi:hypothetical protein